MGYPNLPLGGLGATSSDPLGQLGRDDSDLFNQLRAKQLQSQLMQQANQQAALMGASGEKNFIFDSSKPVLASGLYNQMGNLGFGADLNSLGSGARRDSLSDYTKNLIGPGRGGMGNYGSLNPLTGLTGGLAGTVSPPGIGNNANLLR